VRAVERGRVPVLSHASSPKRWQERRRQVVNGSGRMWVGSIGDSYADFLGGMYMKLTHGQRHYREVGRYPALEKIHRSVLA
jgi:hypothetical protein